MANPNPSPKDRFKTGNRANPGGKPRGKTLVSYLREGLEQVNPDGRTKGQVIAEKLIAMAEAGDRQAIKDVFERLFGKVPDHVVTEDIGKAKGRTIESYLKAAAPDEAG